MSEEFIVRLRTLFPENKDDFLMESAENIRAVLKVWVWNVLVQMC